MEGRKKGMKEGRKKERKEFIDRYKQIDLDR